MAQLDAEVGVKGSRGWSGQVQPALVAAFVFLVCLWVRNLRLKRRLPGPFAWPLVGNVMQLGPMPHITFMKLAQKYGNVYQIRLGCRDIVVLNGERAIRQALIQHGAEFAGRPDFVSFRVVSSGKSLIFSSYSKQWRLHRKVALSTIRAFSSANSQIKKTFEQQIAAEATELVETFLDLGSEGRYFDPAHNLTAAAANVICALCFGKRYGHDDAEFQALIRNINEFGKTVGAGSLVDVMPWLQLFPNPVRSVFKKYKELTREFSGIVQRKVDERRATFDPNMTRDMSDAIIGAIDRSHGADGLTKGHVEATVADLIGAGLDTVATTLRWMILLLVKHREIQSRLHELLDAVVGPGRLPSAADRPALAYLDAFIYETLRFSSFVPITLPHATTSDVTVEGLRIPKDTVVFVNQWSVNHDPLRWKRPHVFDPSRFLDASGSLDSDRAADVMIFSVGKRRCVGEHVAKVQVFLFAAILLHQCRFERCPGDDLSVNCSNGLTLRPGEYKVTAQRRGQRLSSQ